MKTNRKGTVTQSLAHPRILMAIQHNPPPGEALGRLLARAVGMIRKSIDTAILALASSWRRYWLYHKRSSIQAADIRARVIRLRQEQLNRNWERYQRHL